MTIRNLEMTSNSSQDMKTSKETTKVVKEEDSSKGEDSSKENSSMEVEVEGV